MEDVCRAAVLKILVAPGDEVLKGGPEYFYKRQDDLVPDESDRCGNVAPNSADDLAGVPNGLAPVCGVCSCEDVEIEEVLKESERDDNEDNGAYEASFPILFHYLDCRASTERRKG